jgi:hypothetical protein
MTSLKCIHLLLRVLCPDERLQWRILHLYICEFGVVINDDNRDSSVCIHISRFSDLIKDDSGDSSIVDGFSVNYQAILHLTKLER